MRLAQRRAYGFSAFDEGFERGYVETLREIYGSWFCERTHYLRLPVRWHMTIADKGRRFAFVAEILAPSFPFLGGAAKTFAKARQCSPKRMWIGVGQVSCREGRAKYAPNGLPAAPGFA
jgi:hypothetical protein